MSAKRIFLLMLILLAALWPARAQEFGFGGYEVVSSERVGRTVFEYVMRVRVTNGVAAASGLSAQVFSLSADTEVVEGEVEFGDVSLLGSAVSLDTFTVRHDRQVPFDPGQLLWFATAQSMPLSVTITNPPGNYLTNGTAVAVRGSVGGAVEGVRVQGVLAAFDGTNFSAVVNVEEGRNTLSTVATNRYGGLGTANVIVTRDTVAPLVSVQEPAAGAVLVSRQITVSGLVNDAVPGTVNPEQASVTVNGLASTVLNRTFTISDVLLVPGSNTIQVVARDRAGNQTTQRLGVTYRDVAQQKRLVALGGDGQTGKIGDVLPEPLLVELVDGDGVPQTNQPVTFNVTRNDGNVLSPPEAERSLTVPTDDKGQARVLFQLGTRTGAGNNQVTVSSAGVLGDVLFCATATGAPPAKVSALIPESQVGQVGQPLPIPWTTYVTDDGGNPVAGVPVEFSVYQGGGNFYGAGTVTTNTDGDGRAAAIMTLGPEAGVNNNVAVAKVSGVTNSAAVFTASALTAQQAADTRIVGVVLDNANRPMSNVLCSVMGTLINGVTDEQGQFVLAGVPVGAVRLLVDARNRGYPGEWHFLQFDLVTVAGQDNALDRPIYMLPMDEANAKVAGGPEDVVLQLAGVPGSSLTIYAQSVRDANGNPITNLVSWTQVNAQRVPMQPPGGSQFSLAWSVQPANLRFNPPAKVCVPNSLLGQPGQVFELFGFDHDIGTFVSIGTGTVSPEGDQICSDPGFGITKSGWGGGAPPPPPCTPVCGPRPPDGECYTYQTIPPASDCDCPTYRRVPGSGSCDDGNDCTINDRCQNGICKGDRVEVNAVNGPCVAAVNTAVTFTADSNSPDKVKWVAPGGTPPTGTGGSFTVTFANEGEWPVIAYCATAKSKTVGVGPAAASVTANLNEEEISEAPDAGNFGQVKRKSHSAVYKGVVDGNKWCFRLDEFKEKHAVGVQSLGRTDITSANDSDITPANVCAVIASLTPPAANAGHGPPRTSYYNSAITLSHENFHVSDFRDKVSTPTMNDLRDYVQGADKCTDCKSAIPTADFNSKMEQLWNMHRPTYFDGNHEVRAHNHSNPQYATLIQAIRDRIAAAPPGEGWPNCP